MCACKCPFFIAKELALKQIARYRGAVYLYELALSKCGPGVNPLGHDLFSSSACATKQNRYVGLTYFLGPKTNFVHSRGPSKKHVVRRRGVG
jgi:hypothetical protein